MIRLTQTRTGRPAGNCLETSIACILEVPVEEVPDLYDPSEDPDSPTWRHARWAVLHAWLRARGLMYVQVQEPPAAAFPVFAHWFGADFVATSHYLRMGYNPDGVGHATVGLRDEMVWDPNPLRRGITGEDEVVFLVPLEMISAEWRGWPGLRLRSAS